MEKFDIHKTDFHSLRLLISVHRLRSISAAADAFDMNQSSVSYVIDKMRTVFDDPLFVRLGRNIEPTERCNEVVKGARALVREFGNLTITREFDPEVANDRFVISCNYYERSVLIPPLLNKIRQRAPNVRIAIIPANVQGARQLEAGECDLLLSPLTTQTSGLKTHRIFKERYACFVDKDSVYARKGLTLKEYAAARHIMVNYQDGWRPFYRDTLEKLGISIEPVVEMPSFGSIDRLVSGTDLVLTASSGLADVLAPRLTQIPAPFNCSFTEYMSWTGRTNNTRSHQWLRNLVVETANNLQQSETAPLPPQ